MNDDTPNWFGSCNGIGRKLMSGHLPKDLDRIGKVDAHWHVSGLQRMICKVLSG